LSVYDELHKIVDDGGRAVVLTVVSGPGAGAKLLVREDGTTAGDGPAELAELAPEALRKGRSHVIAHGDSEVFADVFAPPARLLIIGAIDTAEALCRAVKLLGWTSIVADARAVFATRERLPSADEIIVAWPEEALEQVKPDLGTAIVVLTHDDKFDLPALSGALATEAFYIGALGSRKNQERRRERLVEYGVSAVDFERISGPCGLDVGASRRPRRRSRSSAEMLAVRAARPGGKLKDAKTRIHVEPSEPAVQAPDPPARPKNVGSRRCCCARSDTPNRSRSLRR
jgi:Xanthine and CO dehydrogenases maturation factor, XdhC/CoxF family